MAECNGERIIKIGQRSPKLSQKDIQINIPLYRFYYIIIFIFIHQTR